MTSTITDAVRDGDATRVTALLDAQPAAIATRIPPYEWTLLHAAAHAGHLAIVDVLLTRGLDPNVRERGDETTPLHWAAAAGHVDVVRRLIDAGADVVGHGDDHQLDVIGWATCWDGCDDDAHRAVVDMLVRHGARHHIFSAIAFRLADEVRRVVERDPTALSARMSRNENHRTPLHFAVDRHRPDMVALLLTLGADPLATDADGYPPSIHATRPDDDVALLAAVHRLTVGEIDSADRGARAMRATPLDLLASVVLGEWPTAQRIVRDTPSVLASGGVLHLAAKRGDARAVAWLLEHGADANVRWAHWDANVTPLHLAAWQGHADVVRALLDRGADPTIRDSKHDGDAIGWAEHGGQADVVRMLRERISA